MTTRKILFILFILFILVRLPLLDQINLLHDERDIVLSGWSIAQTGRDLFGNQFPLVFQNISPNNPLFAIYFSGLWFLFIPIKSVFLARLPFLLVSSLFLFISFKIIKCITDDDRKSLITTAILCFNPWIFHITRLALDIPLAIVFLFGGILFYLEKKKFLALFLFFLTGFTYQGSRLLIPFLLIYLELYFLINPDLIRIKQKLWKSFVLNSLKNLLFITLLIVVASFLEPGISQNRLSEIIFFDTHKNASIVDFRRITSIAPLGISRFFDNKFTIPINEVVFNFTKGLDPNYLFKNGDFSPINGNAVTGQFFFIFIIFYFLGIISLGKKSTINDLYLLGLIPLGMIPALLSTHGLSFSIRGVISSIGFSYLFTLGVIYSYDRFKNLKFKFYVLTFILFILCINLIYFVYGYYFRRPVTIGELFNENERQLSVYLLKDNKPFTIYHQSPQEIYLSYIFFKNNLNMNMVQQNLKQRKYNYDNVNIKICDHEINYLKLRDTIVHDVCLDKKTYEVLNSTNNKRVKTRIPYHDFSLKTAYFIIE